MVPAPDAPQAPSAPQGVQTVPMGDNSVVQPPSDPMSQPAPTADAPKSKGSKGVMIAAIVGGVFILVLLLVAFLAA